MDFFGHVHALDVFGGSTRKVSFDQVGIREGINAKPQAMAVKAGRANHFFIRVECGILVMLNEDSADPVVNVVVNAGHMAAGTTDPLIAGDFTG